MRRSGCIVRRVGSIGTPASAAAAAVVEEAEVEEVEVEEEAGEEEEEDDDDEEEKTKGRENGVGTLGAADDMLNPRSSKEGSAAACAGAGRPRCGGVDGTDMEPVR